MNILTNNKNRPRNKLKAPKRTNNRFGAGFTLLEIIITMGIIISILTSALVLVNMSVTSTKTTRMKIIAMGLSQEGLEIVRNIRDNNWLSNRRNIANWRFRLMPGDYLAQYNSSELLSFATMPLKLNSSGFYQYDDGNDTLFYRKITLEHIDDNQLRVISEVTWTERGRSNTISAETRLYNWLEES